MCLRRVVTLDSGPPSVRVRSLLASGMSGGGADPRPLHLPLIPAKAGIQGKLLTLCARHAQQPRRVSTRGCRLPIQPRRAKTAGCAYVRACRLPPLKVQANACGGAGARENTGSGSPIGRCSCERPPRRFLDRGPHAADCRARRCAPAGVPSQGPCRSLTRGPATSLVVLVCHGPALIRDPRSGTSPAGCRPPGGRRRSSPAWASVRYRSRPPNGKGCGKALTGVEECQGIYSYLCTLRRISNQREFRPA